jgi:hypothetical protein
MALLLRRDGHDPDGDHRDGTPEHGERHMPSTPDDEYIRISDHLVATAIAMVAAGGIFGFAFLGNLDEPIGDVVTAVTLPLIALGFLLVPISIVWQTIAVMLRMRRRSRTKTIADEPPTPTTFRH